MRTGFGIAVLVLIVSCSSSEVKRQKFEPADGECILFVGQDLGAIGGLEGYNDGYFDHFEAPGGFTMYTNFRPGDTSFGYIYKGLDGLVSTDNWGSGDCNMQLQIMDDNFEHSALAIGLELVNHDSVTAYGERDKLILELGKWIKKLGDRPVFLRIGYEFDAPDWNHYDKEHYKKAFRRIRSMFDSLGIANVAYVWQSKGYGTSTEEFKEWYPGDEYVDWCGYSHFAAGADNAMIQFARLHDKPVFIAEATPMMLEADQKTFISCFLSDSLQAEFAWEHWFKGLFETINQNPDVVKAVSYISVNWPSQAMWENNAAFRGIDSRVHVNPFIKERWKKEVGKNSYLKASPELFDYLRSKNP